MPALPYELNEPTASKYLWPDGSIRTADDTVVEPANSDRADTYARALPIAVKWLYPDGSISDTLKVLVTSIGGLTATGTESSSFEIGIGVDGEEYLLSFGGKLFIRAQGTDEDGYTLQQSLDGENWEAILSGGGTVFIGNDVPTADTGKLDGLYIDSTHWVIYGPKTADGWGNGVSLIGPQGPQGEQGLQGMQGNPGADSTVPGPPGDPGADGRTILPGDGAPDNALGTDGDFYIDTTVWDIYGPKTGDAWGAGHSLIGPQGIPGLPGADSTIPGPAGMDGAAWHYVASMGDLVTGFGNDGDYALEGQFQQIWRKLAGEWQYVMTMVGNTMRHGAGVPAAEFGVDGDFYIDTAAWDIYGPKDSGAWGEGHNLGGVSAGSSTTIMQINASQMRPTASSGCATAAVTAIGPMNVLTLDFDEGIPEKAFLTIPSPADWDGGPIKVSVVWTAHGVTGWNVSGAGTAAVNGSYTQTGTYGGYPYYNNATSCLQWSINNNNWLLRTALMPTEGGASSVYYAYSITGVWTTFSTGVNPPPTVTELNSAEGNVVWSIGGRAFENDVLTQALGTFADVTDTSNGVDACNTSDYSAEITLAGSGALWYLELQRKANDAGDTLPGDAKVLGVRLQYNL